jgi:hypothetical protein
MDDERTACCWICGASADTAEHKFKRSVLSALYEFQNAYGDPPAFHYRNGALTAVRGPNSAKLKFDKTLCARCNNQRTQAYDWAFDRFVRYLISALPDLQKIEAVDWTAVYGINHRKGRTWLALYLAKLLGCEIARCSLLVPPLIQRSVATGVVASEINVFLARNMGLLRMNPWNTTIGFFGLSAMMSRSTREYTGFHHGLSLGCIELHIHASHPIGPEAGGTEVLADSGTSRLAHYEHLPETEKHFMDGDWMTAEHATRILESPETERDLLRRQWAARLRELGLST